MPTEPRGAKSSGPGGGGGSLGGGLLVVVPIVVGLGGRSEADAAAVALGVGGRLLLVAPIVVGLEGVGGRSIADELAAVLSRCRASAAS